jgi:hypothetical protein
MRCADLACGWLHVNPGRVRSAGKMNVAAASFSILLFSRITPYRVLPVGAGPGGKHAAEVFALPGVAKHSGVNRYVPCLKPACIVGHSDQPPSIAMTQPYPAYATGDLA